MSEAYAMDQPAEADPQAPDAQDPQTQPQGPAVLALVGVQNIAHHLKDTVLASMGTKVCEEYEIDETSRVEAGWTANAEAALKLALQVREEKSYPWAKASNVKFPLISTAAIQFNARAYPAIVDGANVAKGKVLGKPDEQKQDRADRIGRHMSYQLLEEMDDWEEDTDRLLMVLPIIGCAFRKTYFDPLKGYNCSHMVLAKDFVVNYAAKDLDTCPRATHVLEFYPHEIQEKMRSGLWLEADLGTPTDAANDDQAPHMFLEQHRLWDLDDDDYPEPYIVTVHKETQKVVRVVARFDETGVTVDGDKIIRIVPCKIFTKYGFIPAPDGSFYDVGFGMLLNPLSETINSTINQLMDAGHLANVQGGFIGDGVSIKSGSQRFAPGEWKKAQSNGGPLKDQIVPLPVKEPSEVLFKLLGMLIEASKDVTATQDILTGDTVQANQPVGTTLAVIEQGLKTFSSIVKRIHRALKHELGILFYLNGRYLNPQVYFTFQDEVGVVAQADYQSRDVGVVPVSDPAMATDMQKMGRAQFLMQFLGKGMLNDEEVVRRVLEAGSIADITQLMQRPPPPPDPKLAVDKDKIDIEHRKLDIAEAEARAQIAVDEATAQNTMVTAMLALPQFQLAVSQFIDQRVQQQLEGGNGGQPPVQPADLSGLAGQPGQPSVLPVPGGPAGAPSGGMGVGPADGQPPPDQGPPPGGAPQPGLG